MRFIITKIGKSFMGSIYIPYSVLLQKMMSTSAVGRAETSFKTVTFTNIAINTLVMDTFPLEVAQSNVNR